MRNRSVIYVLALLAVGAAGCGSADVSGYRPPTHLPDAGDDAAVEDDVVAPADDVQTEPQPDVVAPPVDVVVPGPDVVAPIDVVVPRPDVVMPPADVVMPRPDVVMPPADVVVPPPYDAGPPSTCVSGTRWTRGNTGSALMNPGQACVACHVMRREGPQILGGTAYYQDHEENNCNGFRGNGTTTTGGAFVEATDAAGYTFRMAINQAGNFYYNSRTTVRYPLHGVAVVGPTGNRNAMDGNVPHGDCNACHTQAGTTTVAGGDPAPGRIIVLP